MSGTTGFRFGDFEARVADGTLRRAGFRVRLQDLPFRLLVALAERPGELVTREELRRVLWPTETHGDFAHRLGGALNRLREALGDPADRPRVIETIPRRGYRFCATVERIEAEMKEPARATTARITSASATRDGSPPVASAPLLRRRPRLVLAAALLLALSTGAWRVVPASIASEERVAVAVLPFDLASGDPPLAGARTQEAVSRLSRELGVAYVVEGSSRRGRGGVRVTARLLDARTQAPVWSTTFGDDGTDTPALEGRVARAVADAVAARVAAR
jgi:DNA-binding winged helix-turn-helix (wHTH) protein/TolB-like protein